MSGLYLKSSFSSFQGWNFPGEADPNAALEQYKTLTAVADSNDHRIKFLKFNKELCFKHLVHSRYRRATQSEQAKALKEALSTMHELWYDHVILGKPVSEKPEVTRLDLYPLILVKALKLQEEFQALPAAAGQVSSQITIAERRWLAAAFKRPSFHRSVPRLPRVAPSSARLPTSRHIASAWK